MEYFSIDLKNPDGFYYAGEKIQGAVTLRVLDRMKINCVRFSAVGFAKVQWNDFEETTAKRRRLNRFEVQEHLNINMIFTKEIPKNQELFLEAGDYSYPFVVQLPSDLPPSFEHNYARIRYSLITTIDIPWAFDIQVKRVISVMNRVDLNFFPDAKKTAGASIAKVYGCCFCKTKPIICKFGLLKSGFVPGEKIIIQASIENPSSKAICKFKISLVQYLKLKAQKSTKNIKRSMITLVLPKEIKANSKEEFKNLVLNVPPLNPSSFSLSNLVEISYFIKLTFDIEGPSIDSDLIVPITIGTIPLRSEDFTKELSFENQITYKPSNILTKFAGDKESSNDTTDSNEDGFNILYPIYRFNK